MKKFLFIFFILLIFSCSNKKALFIEDDFYKILRDKEFNAYSSLKKEFKKKGISVKKVVIPVENEDKFDISIFIAENKKYDYFILSPFYEKFVYQYATDNPDKIFIPLETIKNYGVTNIIPVILNCSQAYSELGKIFANLDGKDILPEGSEEKKDVNANIDNSAQNGDNNQYIENNQYEDDQIGDDEYQIEEEREIVLEPILQENKNIKLKSGVIFYNSSKRVEDEFNAFKDSFNNFKNESSSEIFVYSVNNVNEPNIVELIKDCFVREKINLILLFSSSLNAEILGSFTQNNLYIATQLWSKRISNYNQNIYYSMDYDYEKAFENLAATILNDSGGFKQVLLEGKIKKIKKHSTLYNIVADI